MVRVSRWMAAAVGIMLLVGCSGSGDVAETPSPTIPPGTTSTASPTVGPTRAAHRVAAVLDGDTVRLTTGETIRLIGIDAPEIGSCGAASATERLSDLVLDKNVLLEPGARTDRDRYGRLLRYISVGGQDAGMEMVLSGLAKARYDSRDGYGKHPREAGYRAADAAAADVCSSTPTPTPTPTEPEPEVTYETCDDVREAGATPFLEGDPGWEPKFDRDGDGIGCE